MIPQTSTSKLSSAGGMTKLAAELRTPAEYGVGIDSHPDRALVAHLCTSLTARPGCRLCVAAVLAKE
jgi:hypothetical protein